MADDREWVPVEVIWDEHLREPDPWEREPPLRGLFAPLPSPERPARGRGRTPLVAEPDDDWPVEGGPRRKGRGDTGLTKRRRKKRRAWESGDDE